MGPILVHNILTLMAYNLTLKNILDNFEDFFSGILITCLLCYKHSVCVGAKINDGLA